MIKASEYAECSYCIGRFAAGLVTPDQFKTGERIALDIVLPKLDNDADAVAEAVKNKGRRGHGTSARRNAATESNGDCQKVSNSVMQPRIVGCWSSYHCIAFVLIIG